MALLSTSFASLQPVLASGIFPLPRPQYRVDEIMGTLTELYERDHLERLAAIDLKRLAKAISSPIPIRGRPMALLTRDHDSLAWAILTAPSNPKDRGEFLYSTFKAFYMFYWAVPKAVQALFDGFLVEQGLLPPFRPKYL